MKPTKEKFFLNLIVFAILIVPLLASAKGLVPCGTEANPEPCTVCHLFMLISNVINFILFSLLTPLAVLGIIIGGIMILTAGGSEDRLKRGKAILSSVIIGIFLAFAAWLIVDTILKSIVDPGFAPNWAWNKFPECR